MNKKKLLSIGEALIDFIPEKSGCPIRQVEAFQPAVGGAPANVCGAFTKLGGESAMITQLGSDPFGDKIVEEFMRHHISCDSVRRTDRANTSLAFVALDENGNREFSFYRKPGADMLLEAKDIKEEWFEDAFALHFCSVSLGDFPMRDAHRQAIEYAKKHGVLISFDPNLRFPLWESKEALKKTVREFLPLADIVKISDEELAFITDRDSIEDACELLLTGSTKLVIFTKGPDGAEGYTRNSAGRADGVRVKALDTTGAGDAFIGSFLYQLSENGIDAEKLDKLTSGQIEEYLRFSNRYCAKSVLKNGAIASYPTKQEMEE